MGAGAGNYISSSVGAIGGGLTSHGQAKEQKKSNEFYRRLFSPESIYGYAAKTNPWLFYALGGKMPTSGWGSAFNTKSGILPDLQKIVSGEVLSPYLLNQPLNQLNRGYGQNLAKMQALIGRSGGQGGLANAYALANIAGRNNAIANTYQKYGQFRETQRRSDLDWLFGLLQGANTQGLNMAQAYGNKWSQPTSFLTAAGNAALGYAGMQPTFRESTATGPSPMATSPYRQGAPAAWDLYNQQGNANQWYSWPTNVNTYANPTPNTSSWGYSWPQGTGSTPSIQTGSTPGWYNASNFWK